MRRNNIFWGLALIVLGGLFFLQAQGIISNVFAFIWPLFLILVGGWIILNVYWKPDPAQQETFTVPLQGAKSVRYKFAHGAGSIEIRSGAPMGAAIVGSSAVGMNQSHHLTGDRLDVKVEAGPSVIPFIGPDTGVWRYEITQEVPVTLKIEAGASRLDVDLENTLATHVELSTGASSSNLVMPARGASILDIEAGAASINIRVPSSTAARIRVKEGLTSMHVDQSRFPQLDTGMYQSANYDSSADRAEITIEGGLGSVTIK